MSFDYDLFIIGAGPGGIAASKQAAKYGVRVAIAEQEALGGTCVNRGCIPKKFIVYAADFALQDRFASSYGWSECLNSLIGNVSLPQCIKKSRSVINPSWNLSRKLVSN